MFLQLLAVVLVIQASPCLSWKHANCHDNRVAIVHLFGWKWTDIAAECERFLGPMGYCGVQVSPPNEHAVITNRPWWERYQPVSYILGSRSGNHAEFVDMVQRCNAAKVRIYVDAILNHMAGVDQKGVGSAGSEFNADDGHFPGVPFSIDDFHGCDACPACCCINSWMDLDAVRVCRLSGLIDLKSESAYVMDTQAAWMNSLVDMGVAGFRLDAAKHMYPEDIEALETRLKNLPDGNKPFMFLEVIDMNQNGEIRGQWYTHLGRVTDFRFCSKVKEAVANLPSVPGVYDGGWGMIESDSAFVFVDNHDNQRGHGAGGDVLTFEKPKEYKIAQGITLGWNHGYPRLMSSYYYDNTDQGPPMNDDESVKDVTINADGSCGNNWVCEHRWQPIAGMASFSKAVAGQGVSNYWTSGNQVAWSRGNKGFFAATNHGSLDVTLPTGLPSGHYCNVIQGCPTSSGCVGDATYVDGSGNAQIRITDSENPMLAIHVEAMSGSGSCIGEGGGSVDPSTSSSTSSTTSSTTTSGGSSTSTSSPPAGSKRTVVFIHAETAYGQNVFYRGGISHDKRPGCVDDADTSSCAISITHNQLGTSEHYDAYNAWRDGDTKLDWYGAQTNQGKFSGMAAEGTPAAWTTNNQQSDGYQDLNQWGDHYWMVDVNMNCDEAEGGWFEVKTVISNLGWEKDIKQDSSCAGSAGGITPYTTTNHMARCGYVNVFKLNSGSCTINNF